MLETPDARPGDVPAAAVTGPDESDAEELDGHPAFVVVAPPGDVAGDEIDDGEPVEPEPEDPAVDDPEPEPAAVEPQPESDVEPEAPEAAPDLEPEEPDEPEPAPEDPAVVDLRAQVAELTQSLTATQRRADELAIVARKQTEMADELHADNRRLRDGEVREAVAPLVRGLARLADDLGRMRATATEGADDLTYLDGQVQELLHDAGVLTLGAEVGEPFDPQCHQATSSATTGDSALHRTIAEVRRAGLRRDDGRILRPVDVVVFRYVAPPPPPQAQSATEEVT